MNPFFLSWIGPCLFVTSVAIQILNRGQFLFLRDGLFLFFLLLQNKKLSKSFQSHVLWIVPFVSIWGVNHFKEPLYFLSVLLASQIVLYSKNLVTDYEEKLKILEKRELFYKNRLIENLTKLVDTEERLDTFLNQRWAPCSESKEPQTCMKQDYLYELDQIERIIGKTLEERKPLKRLRRIVMKQTSLFDDQT